MHVCEIIINVAYLEYVLYTKLGLIHTITGDESLSGVKRTGIFALLVTVRKLYPADGSANQHFLHCLFDSKNLNSDF